MEQWVEDGLIAGAAGALISGLPSTAYSLATGADVLAPTAAAGSLVLPEGAPRARLVAAGVPVHLAISLFWGLLLARFLPRRDAAGGLVAGAAIDLLDIELIGRKFPQIRELPRAAQLADHLAYGAVVGELLRKRRECGHSGRCGPLKAFARS